MMFLKTVCYFMTCFSALAVGDDPETLVTKTAQHAADLIKLGRTQQALTVALNNVATADETLGPWHLRTAVALTILGVAYTFNWQWDKAGTALLRAKNIEERSPIPLHEELGMTLGYLGLVYVQQTRFREAEPLLRRALTILTSELGAEHTETLVVLNSLGMLYDGRNDYEKAIECYKMALAIHERKGPTDRGNVAILSINLASVYVEQVKLELAEGLFLKSIRIEEEVYGPQYPGIGATLSKLSNLYLSQGAMLKAEQAAKRAVAIKQKAFGVKHPSTALSYSFLATVLLQSGKLAQAERLASQYLEITESWFGTSDARTAAALMTLAQVYYRQGKYQKAESLLLTSSNLYERLLGRNHPETIQVLQTLASIYLDEGRFRQAEALYREALRTTSSREPRSVLDVAQTQSYLAILLFRQGRKKEAESLLGQVLELKNTLSPNHPQLLEALEIAAVLFADDEEYAYAERLLRTVVQSREKQLGRSAPILIPTLRSLGAVLALTRKYDEAFQILKRARSTAERVYPESHPEVAATLRDLGAMYCQQGQLAIGIPLLQRALEIRERVLGPEHPDTVALLGDLADLQRSSGRPLDATLSYERGLRHYREALGELHPENIRILDNLGMMSWVDGRTEDTLRLFRAARKAELDNVRWLLVAQRAKDRREAAERVSLGMELMVSFHVNVMPQSDAALDLAVASILHHKGQLFDQYSQRADLENSPSLRDLQVAEAEYSNLLLHRPQYLDLGSYRDELGGLKRRIDGIESRLSPNERERISYQKQVDLPDVYRAIPRSSAVVEYLRVRTSMPGKEPQWGKARYVAYVMVKDARPTMVDLGDAQQIDALSEQLRFALSGESNVESTISISRRLYEMVMLPLEASLAGSTNLIISTDGSLNIVPFAALLDRAGSYLLTRYNISYVGAAYELVRPSMSPTPDVSAIMFSQPSAHLGQLSFGYNPLSSSGSLLDTVQRYVSNIIVLEGAQASKEALMAVRSPTLLHIDAHGFFDPNRKGKVTFSELFSGRVPPPDSLARSGLVVGDHLGFDEEKGFVTAGELSRMDLQGTELVTLAFCDSGSGTVIDGEGVAGFRAALSMAGARSQITLLWPVEDIETGELLSMFYEILLGGGGKAEALRQAQLAMMQSGKSPHYWASALLAGSRGPLKVK